MERRSRLPLSRAFLSAVMDARASCLSNSQSQRHAVPTNYSSRFPTSSTVEKCLLNDCDVWSISSATSTNSSVGSASSVPPYKSSSVLCSTPANYSIGYFRILVDDATDRLEEASKFFHVTSAYSFKFEFYIEILNDLYEELSNPPRNMEIAEYANVAELRYRLRQQQLNLVEQKNQFLGHVDEQSRNLKFSLPAGVVPYLKAAAEAKAARERVCQMVILIERIANLGREEDWYKQQRLQAEAELMQYVDKLMQKGDDNGKAKNKSDTVDGIASDDRYRFSN